MGLWHPASLGNRASVHRCAWGFTSCGRTSAPSKADMAPWTSWSRFTPRGGPHDLQAAPRAQQQCAASGDSPWRPAGSIGRRSAWGWPAGTPRWTARSAAWAGLTCWASSAGRTGAAGRTACWTSPPAAGMRSAAGAAASEKGCWPNSLPREAKNTDRWQKGEGRAQQGWRQMTTGSRSQDLSQSYSECHLSTKRLRSAQDKAESWPWVWLSTCCLHQVLLWKMVSAEVNCLGDITDFSLGARPCLPGDGEGGALPHTSWSMASGLRVLRLGDPLTALSPQESFPEVVDVICSCYLSSTAMLMLRHYQALWIAVIINSLMYSDIQQWNWGSQS